MLVLTSIASSALHTLSLTPRAGARASDIATAAIELGAKAAIVVGGDSGSSTATKVWLPDEFCDDDAREFCDAIRQAGLATDVLEPAAPLDDPYPEDWEAEPQDLFRPLSIDELWVAPLLCTEPAPAESSLQVRLLDSLEQNVFLTTSRGTLHASTNMLLQLLSTRRDELTTRVLDYGCGAIP